MFTAEIYVIYLFSKISKERKKDEMKLDYYPQ